MGPSKIGGDDRIPVGPLHAHKQSIAGDAGVVHENINFPKLVYHGFGSGLDFIFVGNIHFEGSSFAAGSFDLAYNLSEFLFITRGQRNFGPRPGQRNSATTPIPLSTTWTAPHARFHV